MAPTDEQEAQDADDIVLLRDISLDGEALEDNQPLSQLARANSNKSQKSVRITTSPLSQRIRHFSDNLALMHSSFSSRTSSVPDVNYQDDDEESSWSVRRSLKSLMHAVFRYCFAADSFENTWGKLRFMRFYAASADLLLLNTASTTLSLCGAIISLFLRTAVGWICFFQIIVFPISLVGLHIVRERKLLSPEASLRVWSTFSMAQMLIQPSVIHILLGGFSNGQAGDILFWTMFSPAIVFLSLFDATQKLEPHKAANWESHVLAHPWFLIVFAVRAVSTVLLAAVDAHVAAEPSDFLVVQLYHVANLLLCPLLLVCLSRVSRSDFIDRRATFLKVTDAVHFQQVRIEKLVHSMVPEFHVQELRDMPTEKWWTSPPVEFGQCTILQMDIAGFTQLSSRLDAEELIDLLNAVYTQIDQAAQYIGQIWKVETIGDCYIAVAGGPLECEDHATRALTLGLCILDIAEKISAIAQVAINVRVGVHSGRITVAGFGALMPRCLIFGKDPHVARMLEASGEYNAVHVSEAALQEVAGEEKLRRRPHDKVEALASIAMSSYTLQKDDNEEWWCGAAGEFDGLTHFHKDLNRMSEVARERERDAETPGMSTPGMSYVRQLSTLSSAFSTSRSSNAQSAKADSVFTEMGSGDTQHSPLGASSGSSKRREIAPVPEEEEEREEKAMAGNGHGGGAGRKEAGGGEGAGRPASSLHLVVREDSVYPIAESVMGGGLNRGSFTSCPVSEKQAAMVRSNEGGWLTHRTPNLEAASEKAGLLRCERRRRVGVHMLTIAAGTAVVQAITMLLVPLLPAPRHCRPEVPAAGGGGGCLPHSSYQLLAVVPLGYAALAVGVVAAHHSAKPRGGANGGRARGQGQWGTVAAWEAVIDAMLFAAPVAFVGALDGAYCSTALVWGAATAVLRGTFDDQRGLGWLGWFGAYAAVVVTVVAAEGAHSGGWKERDSGWMLFLHCVHMLVPTSVFLVPGISCSCQMMTDDRCSEMLLDQNLKTTIREKELLEALVPKPISRRLRRGERHIADSYSASVCFIYLDDLQALLYSEDNSAVLRWINLVQVEMDKRLQRFSDPSQLCKVETFQDFYMVVCGCPMQCSDHSEIAIDVAAALTEVAIRIPRPDGRPTAIKVGVSSGPLCAGVIGERSPRWSVFGDTVNTASRMASSALPSSPDLVSLHISSSTVRSLPPDFLARIADIYRLHLTKRGDGMDIKGKGFMQTYFLTSATEQAPAPAQIGRGSPVGE